MRLTRSLGALLLALSLLATGCSREPKEAAKSAGPDSTLVVLTPDQAASAQIGTATVQHRASSDTLRLPGTVLADPRRTWRVSPFAAGIAEEVGAIAHEVVRKGRLLARLRSAELGEAQAAWLESRAALRLSSADRERNLVLRKDGVVSESQWLRVDTEYQRAQSVQAKAERRLALAGMTSEQIEVLDSPQRHLGELLLTSPADGIVLEAAISRGQSLAAGQEAFVIADLSTIWVNVDIPVARLSQVKPGARATVRAAGGPASGWSGLLGSLGGNVVPANQTVAGRIIVTNLGGFLRPGMYAAVEVVGEPVRALMVPSEAVFRVGNQAYVFQRVDEVRFRPLAVTPGSPVGGSIPIDGPGIESGLPVVTSGLAELKSHWLYEGGE